MDGPYTFPTHRLARLEGELRTPPSPSAALAHLGLASIALRSAQILRAPALLQVY